MVAVTGTRRTYRFRAGSHLEHIGTGKRKRIRWPEVSNQIGEQSSPSGFLCLATPDTLSEVFFAFTPAHSPFIELVGLGSVFCVQTKLYWPGLYIVLLGF